MTLLTIQEVMARLNISSRATIYRWMADGDFPRPIYLANRTPRWKAEDIDAWIESRTES
jgi:prophage regulatory protein